MAVGVGFEPTRDLTPLPHFKCGAISQTLPSNLIFYLLDAWAGIGPAYRQSKCRILPLDDQAI